ncbi:MAG: hypothetical protein KAI66_02845 [Lentisphaeria bacterium]|nr:hypothetical protein [Lentisphaeria bacterium]
MSSHPAIPPSPSIEGAGEALKALVRMFQALFFLLRILIILTFVFLIFSGAFYVKPQYEVMLFRFGKLQSKMVKNEAGQRVEDEVLRPGDWYWAWPYPVSRRKQIPAQMSVTVGTDKAFMPKVNPNDITPGMPKQTVLRPGEDGYLLTGDKNIVHASWTLTYRVTDPKRYYLEFYDDSETILKAGADPRDAPPPEGGKELIRNVLVNAVLCETATWSIEDVIVKSRSVDGEIETLQDGVKKRVLALVGTDKLDLGITVQEVSLTVVLPPTATQDAFDRVFEASTSRDTMIKLAEGYREQVVPGANGEAFKILSAARVYRQTIKASVVAQGERFKSLLAMYKEKPEAVLVALYGDTIRDVLERVDTKYIIHTPDGGARQEIRLLLGAEPQKPKSKVR